MPNTISFNDKHITPSKVVCIGRNYVEHIKELGNDTPSEPVIFLKPNSAISNKLTLHGNDEIHYEAELCFLIENGDLTGVGLGLDLTKRLVQRELKDKGLPWERAKAFDGSAVFSEFVAVPSDISNLSLELSINGELRQKGGCSMMLHSPEDLFKEISTFITLENYDIIMTGTPAGVGQVHQGEEFVGRVLNGQQQLIEVNWIAV